MNERGFALVTCMLLIAMVLILSAIASQSITSDLKVAGTDRSMKQAFSIAESGTEEARARMSPVSTSPITDGSPASTTWEAYIGTPSRCQQMGYDSSNSSHFRYDSVSGLNYTVKISHKVNATGQVLRWGDTNEDGKYEESTTAGEPIYVITSIGRNSGAAKSVRIEAARTPPLTSIAALYTKSSLVIKGSSTYISGNEGSPVVPGPGVISKGSITENGGPTIEGLPKTEPNSTKDIDVGTMIDANRAKANISLTSPGTMTGMNWGTPTAGATPQSPLSCATDNVVYISGNVKLAGSTTGCGMLMVDGNLELNGGFQWYGPILIRGSLSFTGGGEKNVTGGILAGGTGSVDDIGGNAVILHSNSALHQVIGKMPLTVLRWVEVF
jgi:type II secretory pathway pseudopilin PulG